MTMPTTIIAPSNTDKTGRGAAVDTGVGMLFEMSVTVIRKTKAPHERGWGCKSYGELAISWFR